MKRTSCGGCGAPFLTQILNLGESPLADEFPTSVDQVQRRYPLELYVCAPCNLVQLGEVVDDAELYGASYGFYSGTSASIRTYYREYADWLLARYPEQARKRTVEIACNDGGLLVHLRDAGCAVVGVDPATGPAEAAQALGLDVWNRPFNTATAGELAEAYGPAGLVVANHVVAHVSDLGDLFTGVRNLLADDGVAVVEVQYLPDLLTGNMIDHVYHEHRFFFTLKSLDATARRYGLRAVHVEWVDRQGGSIRVTLTPGDSTPDGSVAQMRQSELWLSALGSYDGLQGRANRLRDRLVYLVETQRALGLTVAGYGAPAKATTLLHFTGLQHALEWVQDTTPTKAGKFMPGTRIPIVAPDAEPDQPDTYVVLAWNYLAEILRKEVGFRSTGGELIVPIPFPVVL